MISNIRFGAVFVPSDPNSELRDNILLERRENLSDGTLHQPAYVDVLKELIGDSEAESDRGESYSNINERGQVLISKSVSDTEMQEKLQSSGFNDVRIIPDSQLQRIDIFA